MRPHGRETHRIGNSGWLRAAALGANDGLMSTASLMVGLAASNPGAKTVLLAGIASLVAGAASMAAGEYISVSSQADTERADLAKEKEELSTSPEHELNELAEIYEARGLDAVLAREVAVQLTKHDALGAHARDELGITEQLAAKPMQAALASAGAFIAGAILPILIAVFVPPAQLSIAMTVGSLAGLALLGAAAAKLGASSAFTGAMRALMWGAAAMGLAALIGQWVGVHVG